MKIGGNYVVRCYGSIMHKAGKVFGWLSEKLSNGSEKLKKKGEPYVINSWKISFNHPFVMTVSFNTNKGKYVFTQVEHYRQQYQDKVTELPENEVLHIIQSNKKNWFRTDKIQEQ